MGDHKIVGASKGPGYKKDQGPILFTGIRYSTTFIPVGKIFKMRDKVKYYFSNDGSIRRV